jgi:hypothetical protein
MFRKSGETFEVYLDRTLADARANLIAASIVYRDAVDQQILNHVVSEIARKVRGELDALGYARNRGAR